jgi:hypothetical protein
MISVFNSAATERTNEKLARVLSFKQRISKEPLNSGVHVHRQRPGEASVMRNEPVGPGITRFRFGDGGLSTYRSNASRTCGHPGL